METVHLQVHEALTLSLATRRPEVAHPELLGYERFLRTAGAHLYILTELSLPRPQGLPQLSSRLSDVPIREPNTSTWSTAATTLGAAHDLVATHLGPALELRSPEADDIVVRSGAALALRQVSLLLVEGAKATRQLMKATAQAQKLRLNKPIPTGLFREITEANHRIMLNAKAALWDLENERPAHPSSTLTHLQPAVQLSASGPSTPVTSPLTALRVLRRLSFNQAQGRTPASPGSLRDLALLAVAVTNPDLAWLPEPSTDLERLRRAHLVDQLDAANSAWRSAAEDLTHSLKGISKAPAVFELAIGHLLTDNADLSPAVRLAIATSLPRLGHDAGHTIRQLHETNALVSPRREPAALSVTWRPISRAKADELVHRFKAAADATTLAAATLRPLVNVDVPHPRAASATYPAPQVPRPETLPSRAVQR